MVTSMRRSHSSRTSGAPTTQQSLTLAVQDPFWPSALSALRAAVQEQASCLQDKDAEALAAEALKACKNDPKAALAILVAISKIQRALDGARARKDAEAASAATEGLKRIDTDLLGTLRYAACIRLLLAAACCACDTAGTRHYAIRLRSSSISTDGLSLHTVMPVSGRVRSRTPAPAQHAACVHITCRLETTCPLAEQRRGHAVSHPSQPIGDNAENARPEADAAEGPQPPVVADSMQPLGNALKRNIPAADASASKQLCKPISAPTQPAPAAARAAASAGPTMVPNCFETAACDHSEPMEASAVGSQDAPEAQLANVYTSWDYGAYLTDRSLPDMDVDAPTEDLLCLGYDHPGQFNTVDFDQVAQA